MYAFVVPTLLRGHADQPQMTFPRWSVGTRVCMLHGGRWWLETARYKYYVTGSALFLSFLPRIRLNLPTHFFKLLNKSGYFLEDTLFFGQVLWV